MKAFFTARHKDALDNKTLKPYLATNLRVGIERILHKYSECDFDAWDNETNSTYDSARETLITFYGRGLCAYPNGQKTDNVSFQEVLIHGWPAHTLDAIEAWFDAEPPAAVQAVAEKELNQLLTIRRSDWRLVNGLAIKIDSGYLHDEIQAGTLRLMKENQAEGAIEEFQNAVGFLNSGECKQAVIEAHKSVESTMKCVLETQHANFGTLLAAIIKSDIVPNYYEEFLKHFERLCLGAVKERNLPGRGHGQGVETKEVTPALAQFAIHLAGAINHFLLARWIEAKRLTTKPSPTLKSQPPPKA